jgi:hypothetical protein
MPWEYDQSSGQLRHDGNLVGIGYSGAGLIRATGRNNPAMENLANQGPIPRGTWQIGQAVNHPTKGPNTMPLIPVGHDAHGRTGFLIHGNNQTNNASEGCIILGPAIRQQIINSGDTVLNVVQ